MAEHLNIIIILGQWGAYRVKINIIVVSFGWRQIFQNHAATIFAISGEIIPVGSNLDQRR